MQTRRFKLANVAATNQEKKNVVISVGLFMSSEVPRFLLNILQTKPIPKQGVPIFVFIGRFSRDSSSSIRSFLPQNHESVLQGCLWFVATPIHSLPL
jgi:hypothetical protein